jgi:hypothetical protein
MLSISQRKAEVISVHAMKAHEGMKMYSTYSLPQHKMEVNSQLHASCRFIPGKEPPVPIAYEAG